MEVNIYILIFCTILLQVRCGYPPIGDEVQAGSVLLPASRRGRYLANIVRRQAVDGTGIKFNKDADRMNAEAKKKVDVLSEELLPYIIAEQERRTTLYKRVMTAIQNGEKGVTIAEIRNKPPAIIRKGLMYRCPANRAPKEPDGSGVIMCEDEIEPTLIKFEACLSAEDRELYVAENRYFFCNRHRVEGPDLPRNTTTVIGCHPCERTSLNYTTAKCALEDTDDVVVHYRYYPDRTYKFVTELDPDREVCDHWNPCQIGYIFSLPSPDQATPASEAFREILTEENFGDYEAEELVPPVPEDTIKQSIRPPVSELTRLRIPIPPGMVHKIIGRVAGVPGMERLRELLSLGKTSLRGLQPVPDHENIQVDTEVIGDYLSITLKFAEFEEKDIGLYYAEFVNLKNLKETKTVELVEYELAKTDLAPALIIALPSEKLNQTRVGVSCDRCSCKVIMLKSDDGSIRNLDVTKFRLRTINGTHASLDMDIEEVTFQDYGDYFAYFSLADGSEERIKVLSLRLPEPDTGNLLQVNKLHKAVAVGSNFHEEVDTQCTDCEIVSIVCNGENMMNSDTLTLVKRKTNLISFNIPSFTDSNACVYLVAFKKGDAFYYNRLAVLENDSPSVSVKFNLVKPPPQGEQFEKEIPFDCKGECSVEKVTLDNVPLYLNTRRSNVGSLPFYMLTEDRIIFRITSFMRSLMGVEQAVFMVDGDPITKTILEIGLDSVKEKIVDVSSGSTNTTNDNQDDKPQGSPSPGTDSKNVSKPGDTESENVSKTDDNSENVSKTDDNSENVSKTDEKSENAPKPAEDGGGKR